MANPDEKTEDFQVLKEALSDMSKSRDATRGIADCQSLLLAKAREIAGNTWVERVTKALPVTDIESLAALVDSLVLEASRIEEIAKLMNDSAEFS